MKKKSKKKSEKVEVKEIVVKSEDLKSDAKPTHTNRGYKIK